MVAIQFTNRFFGFQPKVRECGQFLQNLRPELLGVFAAGVEVPCKLVEVAAHLAALGRQGGKRRQCILAALRHHNSVLDVHTVQDTADEFGLGEVEFFAGQAYAIRSFSSAVTRTLMMCVFRFRGVSLRFSRACAFGLFISAIFDLL